MKKTFVFIVFVLCVSACRSQNAATVNQSTTNTTVVESSTKVVQPKAERPLPKTASYGEIVNCSPEKFGSGEKLTVTLKNPNGGYLVIKREGEKPDYFLLSAPANSKEQEFAAAADTLPLWQVETLKNLNKVELDSANARAVNLSKINNRGEGKAELVFNQTGWYEILLSNENFEQDDPVITGQCRIYFDKTKTVLKKVQTTETVNDETINWKSETKNLSFQTILTLKNGQPFAFTLSGYRITFQNNSESANDCDFSVEKDKDGSVWQTRNDKTIITGKDESGTPFQMFVEKTSDGFLIDTSAAAENCFNVGMPGDILLTRAGNKYNGRFVTSKSK